MIIDRNWWGEAIMTAASTIHLISYTARPNSSHLKRCMGRSRTKSFRVFGSTGYVRVADRQRTRWDSKAKKCNIHGDSNTTKSNRVWYLARDRLVMARPFMLLERPPSQYQDVVVISKPIAQCPQFYE